MRDIRIETRGLDPEIETPDSEVEFQENQHYAESDYPPRKPQTGRLPARASRTNREHWW
jgi:hypothetical protein